MAIRIWVDAWQLQCCGEPISVGAHQEWAVEVQDSEFLAEVLPPDELATVDWVEERHSDQEPDAMRRIAGEVLGIQVVRCAFGRADPASSVLSPVHGTVTLRPTSLTDGFDSDEDGLILVGYVVTIERE